LRQNEVRELLIWKDMELRSERHALRNYSSGFLGKLRKETINSQ